MWLPEIIQNIYEISDGKSDWAKRMAKVWGV